MKNSGVFNFTRVCERMSCEEYKSIVYVCRYQTYSLNLEVYVFVLKKRGILTHQPFLGVLSDLEKRLHQKSVHSLIRTCSSGNRHSISLTLETNKQTCTFISNLQNVGLIVLYLALQLKLLSSLQIYTVETGTPVKACKSRRYLPYTLQGRCYSKPL